MPVFVLFDSKRGIQLRIFEVNKKGARTLEIGFSSFFP
jgi:hypothetical protein